MKKNNLITIFCIFSMILLISLSSASLESLGSFKQNECMNISQTCASCSYTNISSVGTNVDSNLISNIAMTDYGNGEWRTSFCNTEVLGRYDVKGIGDVNGVDTSFAFTFEVTPNGFINSIGFYVLILILSLGIVIFGLFLRDGIITILGSLGLYFLGLYILFFGLVGMKDTVYTWAIGLIILGLAFYISIKSAYELIVD